MGGIVGYKERKRSAVVEVRANDQQEECETQMPAGKQNMKPSTGSQLCKLKGTIYLS